MNGLVRDRHIEELRGQGFTVLPGVLPQQTVARLKNAVEAAEAAATTGVPDDYAVTQSVRVQSLLMKDAELFQQVYTHPDVLAIARSLLGHDDILLSVSSTISLEPGEPKQGLHADDQHTRVSRPHATLICVSLWALTDFTITNGTTRFVPGSQHWAEPPRGSIHECFSNPVEDPPATVSIEAAAGSVLMFDGALWHGAGANTTDQRRVGINAHYCAGWMRPQENYYIGLSHDVIRSLSPEMRKLCGFELFEGMWGFVNGRSPYEALLAQAIGPQAAVIDPTPVASAWRTGHTVKSG